MHHKLPNSMKLLIFFVLAYIVLGSCTGCLHRSGGTDPLAGAAANQSTGSNPLSVNPDPIDDSSGYAADSLSGAPDELPPIMSEIDGIKIPRIEVSQQTLDLGAPIQSDVGNPLAQRQPSEPAEGDQIIVRLESEPRNLNPMNENSAVARIILTYVTQPLLNQHPETFQYEPLIAERWVAEDVVKLHPDYPGHQRRLRLVNETPVTELHLSIHPNQPTQELTLQTLDGEGHSAPHTWVGVYHLRDATSPELIYHLWSDDAGVVRLSGLSAGDYLIKVAAEVFGHTEITADGGLKITPGTVENPLAAQLARQNLGHLILPPDGWLERQEKTCFTYYLRPDVTWSDGTPFTSRDLQFAYIVANNPAVDNDALRVYYHDLIECEPLSTYIVRMRYRQQYFLAQEFTAGIAAFAPPYHLFAQLCREKLRRELTLKRLDEQQEQNLEQVSAHGVAFARLYNTSDEYNLKPLGTGPYIIDRWERGDYLSLTRNSNYWNQSKKPYLNKIIFKFIPDNLTALRALQAGQLDFCPRLSAEQFFEDLKGPPDWFQNRYVKAAWYTPAFSYFGWNQLREPFRDRRVRVALSLLFDKKTFLEQKLYNAGIIVSGPQYYFGPGYDHQVSPLGYDPEAARDLLAQAGWIDTDGDGVLDKDGKPFKLVLPLVKGRPDVEQRALLFQKELKEVGIILDIHHLEWASFLEKIRAKDFDICTLSWSLPIESDPYQIWHSSGAGPNSRGSNHVSFSHPLADTLITRIRTTLNDEVRKRYHYALHRLLDSEQPYMFLYCPMEFGVYHQRFRGVKWYRIRPGYDLTEWYVPRGEQHN